MRDPDIFNCAGLNFVPPHKKVKTGRGKSADIEPFKLKIVKVYENVHAAKKWGGTGKLKKQA